MTFLYTARLRLEPFENHHLDGLNAMNSQPEVARFLTGQPESREQTAAAIERVQRCWAAWGTSWWAFVDSTTSQLIGAGCVQYLRREPDLPSNLDDLRGNPLEIGWRLHPHHWGRGFATEAAARMIDFAWANFPVASLLAVRHPDNIASERVMTRLGMRLRGIETWYGIALATHELQRDAWHRPVERPATPAHHATATIRPYAAHDWPRLCNIHDAARRNELAAAKLDAAFLPLHVAGPREGLFDYDVRVAEVDGTVLGFAAFSPDELAWLYVDPAASGRGIGTALIRAVLAENGCAMTAEVLEGNVAALGVYRKAGFEFVAREQGQMPGNEDFSVTVNVLRHPGWATRSP
ncbi:MAG: GNAT family N-acetyltransferase [Rubrivivax sp.]|jgi:RimJ/RimL family protein N-acetyltransferase